MLPASETQIQTIAHPFVVYLRIRTTACALRTHPNPIQTVRRLSNYYYYYLSGHLKEKGIDETKYSTHPLDERKSHT